MAGKFRKWEIWTANIKFEETSEVKARPVVIVNKDGNLYAYTAKITSHNARKVDGEYSIQFWSEAGLKKPSVIRLSQMYHLHEDDLNYYVGRLKTADINGVITMLNDYGSYRIMPQ